MVIKKLRLTHFGQFHNKELEFQDGVNIIYGTNEAGKSTVHSFIKGMLFGIEKPRGRESKEELYTKYLPFDTPTLYAGSMELTEGDNNYRVIRNFYKDTKESRLINLDNGRELQITEEGTLPILPELTKSNYSDTISIGQLKASVSKDLAKDIQNYTANLSTSKNNQVDVAKALQILNTKKKALEASNTERKIAQLSEELRISQTEEQTILDLGYEIERLELKLKDQSIRRNDNSNKEYIIELTRAQDKLKEGISLQKDIEELQIKINDLRSELARDIAKENVSPKLEPRKDIANILAIGGVLGALVTMILKVQFKLAYPIWLTLLCVAGIVTLIGLSHILKNKSKSEALVNNPQEDYITAENKRFALQQYDKRYKELSRNRLDLIEYVCNFLIKSGVTKEVNAQTASTSKLKELLEDILFQYKRQENAKLEEEQLHAQHTQMLIRQVEKLRWEQEQLENKREQYEKLEQELLQLNKERKDEQIELRAMEVAIQSIKDLSMKIHDSFGEELNHRISEVVSHLTKGRYEKVYMDEQMNIRLIRQDKVLSLEQLSAGTIAQIYLAIRVATSELLFGETMPILLDDSFVLYDDDRLVSCLEFLRSLKRQVLIFTCQKREQEIMDQRGWQYHFIQMASARGIEE